MTSDKRLRRNAARLKRKENVEKLKPSTWLIVCEGVETEVNYFKKAVDYFNNNIEPGYKIKCDIKGKGMGTTSLVTATDNLLNYIDKCKTKTVPYGKIFIAFDKDDFNDRDFNKAVKICNEKGYIPLWSNEAIELWFLLYFMDVISISNRKGYIDKLNEWFKKSGKKIKYDKNDEQIFKYLIECGNHDLAIKRARKVCLDYQKRRINPSHCYDCTNVFRFFDEIDARIDELK